MYDTAQSPKDQDQEREWVAIAEELYRRTERVLRLFEREDEGRITRHNLSAHVFEEFNAQLNLVLLFAQIPQEWYRHYVSTRP